MRQVPQYLIIGRGRLAAHFAHYFSFQECAYSIWHRDMTLSELEQLSVHASHILILINDDAIDAFCEAHLKTCSHAYLIHCSGRLISRYAVGAHPLMTFSKMLYSHDIYRTIPFVLEEDAPLFNVLFPGFSNDHVVIPKDQKIKYHALCALSGGLTCYLWQQLFARFEADFNFPRSIAFPYLNQQLMNLLQDAEHALTGPIARRDQESIQTHLTALQDDNLQGVYEAFIRSIGLNQGESAK